MSAHIWLARRNRRDDKESRRRWALKLKRGYVPPEPFADILMIQSEGNMQCFDMLKGPAVIREPFSGAGSK